MLVTKLISFYIFWSIRHGIPPWRFFQLNSAYFNSEKGVYSKIEIDNLIPSQWKVRQNYLTTDSIPESYPVFLKPEWGQNSYGIQLAHDKEDYIEACNTLENSKITYIYQELAKGNKEFEIFYIQDPDKQDDFVTFTVTEVINSTEEFPINAVSNKNTHYEDRTADLSQQQLESLKSHITSLPHFRIARIAVKTNSIENLISASFDIIEINLFAPMPLHLLDSKHSTRFKNNFIIKNMEKLAIISGKASKKDFKPFLFYKIVRRHYQLK